MRLSRLHPSHRRLLLVVGVSIALAATLAAGSLVRRRLRAAEVATAFAAKLACSGVFVAGRDLDALRAEDLAVDVGLLRLVSVEIDPGERSATARLWPIERKAVHRGGLGSALVLPDGPDMAALRSISLPTRTAAEEARLAARPWPLGDAGIDPDEAALAARIDVARLRGAVDRLFAEPDPARPSLRTRAVLVLHEGRIVAERYGPGFTAATPMLGWSMSKTVLHALAGIRIAEGKLSLGATGLLPAWSAAGDPRARISLDHLLHMTSGLRFHEGFSPDGTDENRMLFRVADGVPVAAAGPLLRPPGTRWAYSSGSVHLASWVLRRSFDGDDEAYLRFPRARLFDRIGMRSAVIETDPAGTFALSCWVYATARDWARFALLYMGEGVFDGERILPEGWAAHARTPAAGAPSGGYGALVWLNAGTPGRPEERLYPAAPPDMFVVSGYQNQEVCVVPSRRLVLVRLGLTTPPARVDVGRMVADVLEALPPPAR